MLCETLLKLITNSILLPNVLILKFLYPIQVRKTKPRLCHLSLFPIGSSFLSSILFCTTLPSFHSTQSPLINPMQWHNLGQMVILCPFCHAHHWFVEKVTNSPSDRPEFMTCCQRRHVYIHHQSDPPPYLQTTLNS